MGRKRVLAPVDWTEANDKVRRFGELGLQATRIQGALCLEVSRLTAEAEAKLRAIKEEEKALKAELRSFCTRNRHGFAGAQSVNLAHGTVGWRKATKLKLGLSKEATMDMLLVHGHTLAVKVTRQLNKTVMKALGADQLAQVGASLHTNDEFFVTPAATQVRTS